MSFEDATSEAAHTSEIFDNPGAVGDPDTGKPLLWHTERAVARRPATFGGSESSGESLKTI